MSSTNRGGQRSEADFYPTPAWTVDRLLEKYSPPGGRWLEPCAGDGAIIRAVNAHRRRDVDWTAVELRKTGVELVDAVGSASTTSVWAGQDFLKWKPEVDHIQVGERVFDVAITNPPYSIAQAVIDRCLQLARVVVMGPMRLAFLASEERHDWLRIIGLPDEYKLPNRPDFSGLGGDSADYAWFVWDQRAGKTDEGTTYLLDLTPKDVRLAQRPAGWQEARAAAEKAKEEKARAKAEKLLGGRSA